MVIKKIPPKVALILPFEEHHRLVQAVALLEAVSRRASARHVEGRHVSANKRKASEEKDTGLKQKQENKVRKICGPCSFEQTLYHVIIDLKFIRMQSIGMQTLH